MPKEDADASLLLLDTCCLINLFATGRLEEILSVLPYDLATSRFVAVNEVLSIAATDPAASRLEDFENLALLEMVSEGEMADFVRFAAELDDGEASICALAVSRKAIVATDDRKAIRVLNRAHPWVPIVQTPELLYEWAHLSKPSKRDVMDVLGAVRTRARFYPRADAPRFEWWAAHALKGF